MVEHPNLPFRREYTLLAQTPMIHFQHDQSGAALRPSEVKPKFDRYLRKLYGKAIPEHWRVSEQHEALNYQMRITVTGQDKRNGLTIRDCKAYFGNMGNSVDTKDLVFRDCKLEINCFVPELLKLIDQHIGSFFVLHNFGTRQSKGFGGFLVQEKTSEAHAGRIFQQNYPYYFYADFPANTDLRGRLNHAMVVYACLKNGMSMGNRGFPGYAVNGYMYDNVGNDKEFIRDFIMRNGRGAYDSYEFIRAVLGLAENYNYRQRGLVKVIQIQGTGLRNKRPVIPLESLKDGLGIKRFQSPILIKIYENRMYFLLQNTYADILGKAFILMREQDWDPIKEMISNNQHEQAQQLLQQRAKIIYTPEELEDDVLMHGFVDYFNRKKDALRRCPQDWKPSADLILEKGGRT